MDIYVWPYSSHSKSAKDLARKLETSTIRREGSSVVDKADRMIINWGDSQRCPYRSAKIINKPQAVAVAANKLSFFQRAKDYNVGKNEIDKIATPEFTTDRNVAYGWISQIGVKVCSRTTLNGNNGEGLIISDVWDRHPRNGVLLWTKYWPKEKEYRVHVIDDSVVEVQQKVWPSNRSSVGVDFTQRNHSDGFVFQSCRFSEVNYKVIRQARNAVKAVGLDFAGVDVLWHETNGACVLEVNTAPGIEGRDLKLYADSFRDIANRLSQS